MVKKGVNVAEPNSLASLISHLDSKWRLLEDFLLKKMYRKFTSIVSSGIGKKKLCIYIYIKNAKAILSTVCEKKIMNRIYTT